MRAGGTGELDSVVLVSMPFGARLHPSLGLSLLRAALDGVCPVHVRYFGLDFAARTGPRVYDRIADGEPFSRALAGEWIFSGPTLGDRRVDRDTYVDAVSSVERPDDEFRSVGTGRFDDELVEYMECAADQVDEFLDDVCRHLVELAPAVVGFTTMFQQQLSSLALAAAVKQRLPGTTIVFGGANCDGLMGRQLVDSYDFVDAVVVGEADLVFPRLVRRVLDGTSFTDLRGVLTRRTNLLALTAPARAERVEDLDALPIPDHRDFFDQFGACGFPDVPRLLFESSRGCWWGERRHCTFCGLNSETMAYRSKSPSRVLDELARLRRDHPGLPIAAVDNILDMSYFSTVLPVLAAESAPTEMFFEVKSSLDRSQVRSLRDAGVRDIQPGIESLSNSVLRLMRKGVTALQNVQLLKWCTEFGVHPTWNILWGFPEEDPDAYDAMAALVPCLTHLPPPLSGAQIRLDRFSPLFDEAVATGTLGVRPAAAYPMLYDRSSTEVFDLAYFFQFDAPTAVADYTADLRSALSDWTSQHSTSALFFFDRSSALTVWDLRGTAPEQTQLADPDREIYLALDSVHSTEGLWRQVSDTTDLGRPELDERLEFLRERRLIATVSGAHVALAVEVGEYQPPAWALAQISATLVGSGGTSKLAIGEN